MTFPSPIIHVNASYRKGVFPPMLSHSNDIYRTRGSRIFT